VGRSDAAVRERLSVSPQGLGGGRSRIDARPALLLIEGAPLVSKSSLLREMVRRTADSTDMAVLFIPADEGGGIFQTVADLLSSALAWPVTAEEARAWLMHAATPVLQRRRPAHSKPIFR